MIRAEYLAPDESIFEPWTQRRRYQDVINAPSSRRIAALCKRTPPGIMAALAFELAKGINETRVHHSPEPRALFRRETMRAVILFWLGQVHFGVGHV